MKCIGGTNAGRNFGNTKTVELYEGRVVCLRCLPTKGAACRTRDLGTEVYVVRPVRVGTAPHLLLVHSSLNAAQAADLLLVKAGSTA